MNFGPWLLSRGGHLAACIFLRSRSTRKQSRQNPDHRRHLRLMNRLLTQMERILEINALQEVNKAVVKAARESFVMAQL